MELATQYLRTVDPVLAEIIDRVGPCAFAFREATFETLARSITFQLISTKAAATIFARLHKAVGRRFTANAFLKLTPEQLRACGLTRQKMAALTDLAERVARREIKFRSLGTLEDEAIVQLLSQVRGVGVWTAQMFLMFGLRRPNVMPLADLGLRNAVRKAYGLSEMPSAAVLTKIAEKWHPYCSIATWYLWRSINGSAEM